MHLHMLTYTDIFDRQGITLSVDAYFHICTYTYVYLWILIDTYIYLDMLYSYRYSHILTYMYLYMQIPVYIYLHVSTYTSTGYIAGSERQRVQRASARSYLVTLNIH